MKSYVIGIDPSLSATGICWGAQMGRTVKLKADDPKRLVNLERGVRDVLTKAAVASVVRNSSTMPTVLAVIEDLPIKAQSAGLTGQAQGVVRKCLQESEIPYITVVPSTLKKFATGSGVADKARMAEAYPHTMPAEWDDNTVDAYWLRRMGLAYLEKWGTVVPEHFGKAMTAKWSNLPPTERGTR